MHLQSEGIALTRREHTSQAHAERQRGMSLSEKVDDNKVLVGVLDGLNNVRRLQLEIAWLPRICMENLHGDPM
jgi:hypothetical protein